MSYRYRAPRIVPAQPVASPYIVATDRKVCEKSQGETVELFPDHAARLLAIGLVAPLPQLPPELPAEEPETTPPLAHEQPAPSRSRRGSAKADG